MKLKHWVLLLTFSFLLFTLQGCFILGIHTKVKNAKHAGKYPEFTEAKKLLGNPNTKYRTCYDVKHYNLNVYVDEKKKYLKGNVTITANAVSGFDTLQIDLYQNMKVNGIGFASLNSIQEKDTKFINTSYTRRQGAIFIPFKQKAGEIFKINIDYEGSPVEAKKPPWKGGFVWKKDKEKNPWIGVACESDGASLWWPCKDVNNDEPDSVSITIQCSKNLTAVSNGKFMGKQSMDDINYYSWRVSYPINPYDVTLYIGNFKLLADSMKSSVSGEMLPINYYVLPYNYEKAKTHFQQAKTYLSFYEKTFGTYPWYRDSYKLIESPYAGMEHQSAIAYGNGYKNNKGLGFDYIVLHETAHEWWGNGVTASDFADVWLQEGFATYSEALYVESKFGKSSYLRYMLFYRLFIKNKWPVCGPRDVRYFYYKNSDCYQKGAWVLHTLRTQLNNDSVFFDIIKTFQAKFRYKTCTSQDFIDVVNEKTNDEYAWFFKQYLYKREAPILEYYWDGQKFYYRWDKVDADFKMPVEIMLDNSLKITLYPKKSDNLVQITPISRDTYKAISFDNIMRLYGVRENKKLRKMGKIISE